MRNPQVEALGALLRAGDASAWVRVRSAIERHNGRITRVCTDLGVPQRTFYHWQRNLPALRALVLNARADCAKVASDVEVCVVGTGAESLGDSA
jgi:hypothetical protein